MTPKAARTRQSIIDSALHLFATRGYAETTLRDISEHAGVATGLTYRYFTRKEELALALYEELSASVAAQVHALPQGSVGERWGALLRLRYAAIQPHRRTLLALVQAALDPEGELGVMSAATAPVRARWMAMHTAVVTGASPPPPVEAEALARLLYGLDLLLVLVWTQDRTPDASATHRAATLAAGLLERAEPFLGLPGAAVLLDQIGGLFNHLSNEVSS